jgi:UDP-N-acetylmuramate: L-alanyl-gamma-D-glutamyl-meso-diaminopimelate ligase
MRIMWNSLRFCRKIRGGILVYNEDDAEVKRVSEAATNPTRRLAYTTPNYKV